MNEQILREVGAAAIALFPIIDMLGNLPIIINIQKNIGDIDAEKSALTAGLLMVTFLFVGNAILDFMEIPIEAFAVGGAFILFILAIEMILGVTFHKTEIPSSVSIVPIAFPLLAGPGVLTTVLSMRSTYHVQSIIMAIIINIIIVYIVMKKTRYISNLIGETGIIIVHKISGVVLLALSIKLFADNWQNLL
ncbi:MarC family protein [Weeksellaceae bacterium TAE3-ERU29]|nr:MarC family protein [Weeksellaceae bacterium TAE3-ERU29]